MFAAVHLIRIEGPTGLSPVQDDPFRDLVQVCERAFGIRSQRHDVADRDAFDSALSAVVSTSKAERPSLVVAVGHGKHFPADAGDPEANFLATSQTRLDQWSRGSIDLDRALDQLRRRLRAPVVFVVDACEVQAPDVLDGTSSLALAFAHPGGPARADARSPWLTQALGQVIDTLRKERLSIRQVLEQTRDRARARSGGLQSPGVVFWGPTEPFDQIRHESRGATESRGVASAVVTWLSSVVLEGMPLHRLNQLAAILDGAEGHSPTVGELRLAVDAVRPQVAGTRAKDFSALIERLQASAADAPGATLAVQAHAQHTLGWAAFQRGDSDLAREHLQAAQRLAGAGKAKDVESKVLNTHASVLRGEGSLPKAAQLIDRSIQLKTELKDRKGREMSELQLGWLSFSRGSIEQAQQRFQVSVTRCLGYIENREDRPDTLTELLELVDSLAFHLVGLLTCMLMTLAAPEDFDRLRVTVADELDTLARLKRWTGNQHFRSSVDEVNELFELGCSTTDGRPELRSEKPSAWEVALVARTVGPRPELLHRLHEMAQHQIEKGSPYAASAVLKIIVALHTLVRRFPDQMLVRTGRDRIIEAARTSLYLDGLPRPDAPPWGRYLPDPHLHVDTSQWSEWGPLALQRNQAQRTDVFVTSRLTEHYLQHLAWTCMLRLLLDSSLEVQDAAGMLAAVFGRGERVTFNLSQALASARRVAKAAQADGSLSPFGKRLAALFADGELTEGTKYSSLDKIYEERNDIAHRGVLMVEEEQRVINEHQQVIHNVLAVLAEGPEVTLKPSKRPVDDAGDYESVLLCSPTRTLDCGPFLITHARHTSTLFVPHLLSRAAMLVNPGQVKNKNSDYERQDVTSRPEVAGLVKVLVTMPFPRS